jgi:hypothetical protein
MCEVDCVPSEPQEASPFRNHDPHRDLTSPIDDIEGGGVSKIAITFDPQQPVGTKGDRAGGKGRQIAWPLRRFPEWRAAAGDLPSTVRVENDCPHGALPFAPPLLSVHFSDGDPFRPDRPSCCASSIRADEVNPVGLDGDDRYPAVTAHSPLIP